MANFEDGSYSCTPGIALIGKVLAGQCTMNYTRAAVGKGTIGDDESPKTMTEPAGYVMNAKISAVTNPVNGECQVTVQINSSDVGSGFYATGIMLYAEDPDEGEVPYTYLVLENGPEWIRPASSAVGKLATFDLIAAVGDIDIVTATIDPNSIVTQAVVEQMIASATVKRDITITEYGWETDGDGTVYLDIAQPDVTEKMVPIISVHPEYLQVAKDCGLSATCQTLSGIVRIYADEMPTETLTAELVLLNASNGKAGSNNSSSASNYVLPGATKTTLGGVIIGDGIDVDGDSTISISGETLINEVLDTVATDEEAREMLDDVFGNSDTSDNN